MVQRLRTEAEWERRAMAIPSCGLQGCTAHAEWPRIQVWRAEGWQRRPLACRLGIHHHWRYLSMFRGATLVECVRCGHEWKL